jgi:hypothetical protein
LDERIDKDGITSVVGVTTKDRPHFIIPFLKNEDFIGESHVASWSQAYQTKRMEAG